jgi:hypothetical protein
MAPLHCLVNSAAIAKALARRKNLRFFTQRLNKGVLRRNSRLRRASFGGVQQSVFFQ